MGVLIVIGVLVLDCVIACQFVRVANDKGHYELRWFWLCFLFGPIGYMLVSGLPDLETRQAILDIRKREGDAVENSPLATVYVSKGMWVCKKCGAQNTDTRKICRSCGAEK